MAEHGENRYRIREDWGKKSLKLCRLYPHVKREEGQKRRESDRLRGAVLLGVRMNVVVTVDLFLGLPCLHMAFSNIAGLKSWSPISDKGDKNSEAECGRPITGTRTDTQTHHSLSSRLAFHLTASLWSSGVSNVLAKK